MKLCALLVPVFLASSLFQPAPSAQSSPSAPPPRVMRVREAVQASALLKQVQPKYPKAAKDAHITGTLLLHAMVGTDGSVAQLDYVSGPPELKDAAMEAVRKWRYRILASNGQPLKVETYITIVYTAQGAAKYDPVYDANTDPFRISAAAPPPKVPEAAASQSAQVSPHQVVLGRTAQQARLLERVTPVYPPDALALHVEGTVIFEATIGTNGRVKNITLKSGSPLLVQAAQDAVSQWRYSPFTVDGVPQEIRTEISVVFTLRNP